MRKLGYSPVSQFILLLLAVSTVLAAQDRPLLQDYQGRKIDLIHFDPATQPLDPDELNQILPIKAGTPLSMALVRASIQRLYATGRYKDIQVDAEPRSPDPNSPLVIRFSTRNSWFIGEVEMDGNVGEPPNQGQILNASRLELGDPFAEENLKTAADNIKRLLVANGYYESVVTPGFNYSDHEQVNIIFHVTPGKRAHFDTPQLKGNYKLTPAQIIRATKWRRFIVGGWKQITQSRVRQGIEGIRGKYQKSNRLLATISLDSMEYNPAQRRASPHLTIDAGPRVEIKAIGAKVSRKKLVDNVPIFEEHTVDRDLLVEGQRNLREEFQAAGYFEAQVEFKEQKVVNDRAEIDYLITPGIRHTFAHLEIQGNKYFTTQSIRERMFLEPKSFQFRRGRYSEAFVRDDEDAITNLYKSNGFRDVKVAATPIDDYQGKVGNIAVVIHIDEGPQWFVSHLTVSGAKKLDLAPILSTLSSSEDQPFSEFNVAADRDAIISYYFQNGFANANFEWSSTPGVKPTLVDLQFRIVEGEQQFVREVLTMGLQTTRPKLVYRNLLLSPGDPLSPIRMSDTQRRLYDLGVFAQVNMAIQNPDGETERKYVVYDIEEARRYSITGGFGAEIARIGGGSSSQSLDNPGGATGFSPRVSFDVSRINLFGLGHTLSFRSRVSTLQKRGLIDYLAPRIFNHTNFDLTFTALYDDSKDIKTFKSRREEGSIQLTQRFSKPTTLFYRFNYRQVHVSDLHINPLLAPRLAQSVRIGEASVNLIQDRRDDPTDAHKGIYNTVDMAFASSAFGSQANFIRILARNATYRRIGKKLVFARETTMGIEPSFGTVKNNPDLSDPIPLPERFFGGGGSSHRGFPENQAGPRDPLTGFPVGGSALLFNSTELRFPLLGANIGGVIFHDMGNIYSSLSKISFRVKQKDLTDFDYMAHAAGFGIRYRTPIGPVRADLAYSINSPKFNGFKGTFTELVQCTGLGTCQRTEQRISRLQYFFSIGQTF